MTRFLISAPRWLFLALLVFAPWAYGCVRPWTLEILNRCMFLITGVWLASCAVRKLRPHVHPVVWVCSGLLVVFGWWMNINAHNYYDPEKLTFVDIPSLIGWAPGGIDQANSVPVVIRITGLLGIVCFASDLSQREEWRRRIWWTLGFAGASVILLGLVQRILGAPMIFWGTDRVAENFFATYFYHGNAGAFVNLVIPPIAGLALMAMRTPEANAGKAIWYPSLLIALAGAMATASKAALVIAILLVVTIVIWRAAMLKQAWQRLSSPSLRIIALAAVLLAIGALGWFGWQRMMYRWTQDQWVSQSWGARMTAYQACLTILPDSSWWGIGAGNFSIDFPFYTNAFGNSIEGLWRFAHEDYLQTIIEWGYVGAVVWAVLFFGGLISGIRAQRQAATVLSTADRTFLFTVLLAFIGVLLHSTVDFPLQIGSLQLYAALYLGMLWGARGWRSARSERRMKA